ncbi:MAG: ELWxxDGT repeat protein [Acidobacteriota bacterium]
MLIAVLSSLSAAPAGAQPESPPYLLHDLEKAPFNGQLFGPSRISVAFDGDFYYAANDGIHGLELWRSDGTPAGTELVFDICPGWCSSQPERITVAGGLLFFTANDGETGTELWKSDGTEAGTVLVADLTPGPESSGLRNVSALKDVALFSAYSRSIGSEMWRSDGTPEGTYPLADINPGSEGSDPSPAVALGEIAVFGGRVEDRSRPERLFRTDGTRTGTWEIFDFDDGMASWTSEGLLTFFEWPVIDGVAYFPASTDSSWTNQIWRSDGTKSGTLPAFSEGAGATLVQASGDRFFFRAASSAGDRGGSLWVSDGTASGTLELTPTQGCFPRRLTGAERGLFFSCVEAAYGHELWFSDGTVAGTERIEDLSPGPSSFEFLGEMQPVPGGVILSGRQDSSSPVGSWFSDGTPGGASLLPIPTAHGKQLSEVFDGRVLFWGGPPQQRSLYSTDGSSGGTRLIGPEHLQSSSFPATLAGIDSVRSYFSTRKRIWTPPAPASVGWVLDAAPGLGASTVTPFAWLANAPFVHAGGRTLFSTVPFHRDPATSLVGELISVDATLGDARVLSQDPGYQLQEFGGMLYRLARVSPYGDRLTTIDPRTEQIVTVDGPPVRPGFPDRLDGWLETADSLFLTTSEGLWSMDRSGNAVEHASGLFSNDALVQAQSGIVFFTAATTASGWEPWSFDPETGAASLLEVRPGLDSGVYRLPRFYGSQSGGSVGLPEGTEFAGVALGERYLFAADNGSTGVELWATTAEGPPYLVADIAPGPDGSYPQALKVLGNRVMFRANDGVHGSELWTSDGTPQGTLLLRDLRRGSRSSLPQELQVVDGLLVFTAFDDEYGRELWLSDGTVVGTQRRSDIASGPLSSSPNSLLARSGALLFSANDAQRGFELWALDRPLQIDSGAIFQTGFESGDLGQWNSLRGGSVERSKE